MQDDFSEIKPAKEFFVRDLLDNKYSGRAAVIGKAVKQNSIISLEDIEFPEKKVVLSIHESSVPFLEGKSKGIFRVFGEAFFNDNPPQFSVEFLQELKGFNLDLYKKVRTLEERYYG